MSGGFKKRCSSVATGETLSLNEPLAPDHVSLVFIPSPTLLPLSLAVTVPLEEVQREWRVHRGLEQLLTTASHFNLHQDLYGGQQFRPRGFIDVVFGEKTVHRGTILTPSEVRSHGLRGSQVCVCCVLCVQAACPPRVVSGLPRDELCTLVLSNPDGHLLDHSKELLHWMV